ncbi:MAG: hypothetical protein K6C05_05715 [Anaerovibrio sp.]|uniref:hypothetical protein n=1 Tax=Anaerovibrio sp. TaxID=1872532 RepID=UPI0025DC7C76|nr:hypothetical protein [Anaerovibrio sp.]MCR5176331.1 hypothetical protein [Anaerovibrio sp.]
MICSQCGQELNADGICPNCHTGNVREMQKGESHAYDGVTIDSNSTDQQSDNRGSRFYGYGSRGSSGWNGRRGSGPRIIRISSGSGFLTKILIAAAVAVLIAGFVFVALPLAVIAIVVGILVYSLYSFFV